MQVFQIPDWWPLKRHFVFTVPLWMYWQWFFCMTKTVSVNIQAMWFNKARYLNVSGFECQDSDSLLGVVSSQRLSSEACRINDIILLMLAHFYFQHVSSVLSLFILYYCWVFYSILCLHYFLVGRFYLAHCSPGTFWSRCETLFEKCCIKKSSLFLDAICRESWFKSSQVFRKSSFKVIIYRVKSQVKWNLKW